MCELLKKVVVKEGKTYYNFYLRLPNGVLVAVENKFKNATDFIRLKDNAKVMD